MSPTFGKKTTSPKCTVMAYNVHADNIDRRKRVAASAVDVGDAAAVAIAKPAVVARVGAGAVGAARPVQLETVA